MSQPVSTDRLNARQKAAMLMLSLDVETATRLMRQLSQDEIELLTIEISNVRGISSTVADAVTEEFHHMMTAQEYVIQGGIDYAQKLLEHSLGFSKATDVLEKVKALTHVKGFGMLKKADAQQLASFLGKEHPQTIALILSNLSADQAAQVLTEFSEELRNNVSYRMATLGKVSPALLSEVEDVVEDIARTEISQSMSSMGGSKSMAAVLNKCNGATAKIILEHIEQSDPQLVLRDQAADVHVRGSAVRGRPRHPAGAARGGQARSGDVAEGRGRQAEGEGPAQHVGTRTGTAQGGDCSTWVPCASRKWRGPRRASWRS